MAVVSATAVGTAWALYRWTKGRQSAADSWEERDEDESARKLSPTTSSPIPALSAETWRDAMKAASTAAVWSFSETVGKWKISDLTLGWMYLARQEDDIRARLLSTYQPSLAEGEQWLEYLLHVRRAACLCAIMRGKNWEEVLAKLGVESDDLVVKQQKSGLWNPAYIVVRDEAQHSIILIVRGTHTVKDMLTCMSGYEQPHHAYAQESPRAFQGQSSRSPREGVGEECEQSHGISDYDTPRSPRSPSTSGSRHKEKDTSAFTVDVGEVVLGYAHTGMLAAARSLLKSVKKDLLMAMENNPGYSLQIVGHSMGGGTAALLTMMLRSDPEFQDATCIAFATPACVTRELGESCSSYVTTVINGSDVVPTFSAAALDALREEMLGSGWYASWKEDLAKTRVASAIRGGLQQIRAASSYVISRTPFVKTTGQFAASAAISSVRGAGAAAGWISSRSISFSCFSPSSQSYTDLSLAMEEDNDYDAPESHAPDPLSMSRSSLSEELSQDAAEEMCRLAEARVSVSKSRRKMYPPGRILHMVPMKKDTDEESHALSSESTPKHELYHDVPVEFYEHLHLCKNMIRDHFIPRYLEALDSIMQDL